MKVVAKAEGEVKKNNDKDAQDDDDSVRSSLLSPSSLSLSPPVLPSYAVDAIEAIYSSSIKMEEVPRSNSWCAKNSNPCSSSSSSSNPPPSNCIKTEEDADSSSSSKSSDDINVEEVAEDFYNNNTLFFALTNVQQQQQEKEVITTTTDAKALLKTSNATTINSAIIDVDDDDDNNNDDETETETFGNCDDSSNGRDNEENGEGDDLDGDTDADFGQTKGIAKKILQTSKKPTVAVTFPRFLPAYKKYDAPALPFPEKVTINTMKQENSDLRKDYEVLARELEVVKVAFARQMKQQQEVIHQQQTTIAGQQQQIVQLQRKQTSITSDSGSKSDNDDDEGEDNETTKSKKRKSESESESDDDELPKKKKYVSTSSTVHTGVKNAIWNENFQQLLAYKEENGNTNVTRKHPQLGVWVCDQRYLHNIKNLSNARFKQLHNIGFVWSPRDALWTKMYRQLKSYKTRHNGSTQVLASCKENPSLGHWVQTQRKAYNNDTLLIERMELLNSLDFVYESPTRK